MTYQAVDDEIWRIHLQLSKAVPPAVQVPITSQQLDFLRAQTKADLTASTFSILSACFRQINDPTNAPLLEPYLHMQDPEKASAAIWVLCWLGRAERLKPYILAAVEPGFPWDGMRRVADNALGGAGYHLITHRDRDFAQLIIRWATRDPNDHFYRSPPPGQRGIDLRMSASSARTAAGIAMGVDSALMVDDRDLIDASVERFVAERQDG